MNLQSFSFLAKGFKHPWTPTVLYLPLSAVLIFFTLYFVPFSYSTALFYIVIGILSWTLTEYILHRFVFHLNKVKEPWKTLTSKSHLQHHRDTQNLDLVIAPPLVSSVFATIVFFIFALITFSFAKATLMIAGLMIAYVSYEWAHYGAHRYNPKKGFFKYLKDYHLLHHFKDPRKAFGVTSPLWDFVFRTHLSSTVEVPSDKPQGIFERHRNNITVR